MLNKIIKKNYRSDTDAEKAPVELVLKKYETRDTGDADVVSQRTVIAKYRRCGESIAVSDRGNTYVVTVKYELVDFQPVTDWVEIMPEF